MNQTRIRVNATYTYKGTEYKMYHTSHGSLGAGVPSHSIWAIRFEDGQVQVVGVGYHVAKGRSSYSATFPLAGKNHKGGPTAKIKDERK